jgi:L-malate glycosyltransferase
MRHSLTAIKREQPASSQAAESVVPRRPIRVCILAPSLDILGGQSRQAARLLENFRQERDLRVSFIPHNPRLPGPFRALQRIKYVRTVLTTLTYWSLMLARLWRYDVVHVFSASYYSYLLCAAPAILLAKAYRKKVILNYRSGEAPDHLRNWKRSTVPIMRLADEIVVPSGYLVDVFAEFGLRAKPIFNFVELDAFAYRERRPIRPAFLTARLLEPLYNVPCVLRAFALVQAQYPDASLTVAGNGSMRLPLEELARSLGLRNTVFLGGVPYDRMPALYDSADIYLNAPDLDNMPGSLVECLSCGLPVITTDAGGIPYIVSHERTALVVPRGDHVAMASSAIRLLQDSELATTIARRGRDSCQRFTWPEVRQQWLETYRGLMSVRR